MDTQLAFIFIIALNVACIECDDFSDQEKDEFVRIHNEKRLQVQSKNMEYMIWDDDLARSARVWSEGCVWEHGQPNIDIPYDKYGQNLYIQSGVSNRKRMEPSSSDIIELWYGEINDYTYSSNKCKTGKACGHYTQVMWAKSSRVGCGYAPCQQVQGLTMRDTWLVTCNYYPQGNYRGVHPYKTGERCSDCPAHDTCFNDLCRNCTDSKAPACTSFTNPDHGMSLHYQGDLSSWKSLENGIKVDLIALVNNFCSIETTTICCPAKSPSDKHTWAPVTDIDIYTRSKYKNISLELFDVILVPVLPNVTQVTCNEMYLPNGVIVEATNSTNLTHRWGNENAKLVAYDFGRNSSTTSAISATSMALCLVLISILNNWKN